MRAFARYRVTGHTTKLLRTKISGSLGGSERIYLDMVLARDREERRRAVTAVLPSRGHSCAAAASDGSESSSFCGGGGDG